MPDPTPRTTPPRRRRLRPWVRGLGPPLFLTAAGAALIAFRALAPDWRGLSRDEAPAPVLSKAELTKAATVVARLKAEPSPVVPPPPEPLLLPDPPAPAPTTIAAEPPAPEPAPEPEPSAEGPRETPPADDFAVPKEPEPVAAAEAMDGIRRAANKIRADRARLEDIKARSDARDRADAPDRHADQARRQVEFAREDRATFLEDLRRLIRVYGDHSAPGIAALCDRHGRELPPPVQQAVARFRRTRAPLLGRADRIAAYRRLGVPEAVILDDLAAEEALKIGQRTGPRTRAEALLRASRSLLRVPPVAPSPVADASGPPGNAPGGRPR